MKGAMTRIRKDLVPTTTVALSIALLALRLTVGWGMFEAGKGKVYKLMGQCAQDPLPDCEKDARDGCGKDQACLGKVDAQCTADRKASCEEQGQRAIEWFGSLTIAGIDDFKLPGGGKLNFTLAAITETLFGVLLMIGLFARVAALPLVFTMTIAVLTAHWESVGLSMGFVSEVAFIYWVCLWVIAAGGPGRISIDAKLAK